MMNGGFDDKPFDMGTSPISCKLIYWNAIHQLSRSHVDSISIVQEINQTSRYSNPPLDKVREAYIDKLNPARYKGVVGLLADGVMCQLPVL